MTAPSRRDDRERVELDDAQRDALLDELFAHHQALDPEGRGLDCFCGDDTDLVEAVQSARAQRAQQAQQQSQRRQAQQGDDEPEL